MKALILAGGFGTRLREVVKDVPKPMADIAGTPFLEILVKHLKKSGVNEFIFSLYFMADQVIEYFSDERFSNYNISFVVEPEALGTGGAIKYAINELKLEDNEDLLVLNGDTFVLYNLEDFVSDYKDRNLSLSIILRELSDTARYGRVTVGNNIITNFSEKGVVGPGFINAGIYLLKVKVFDSYNLDKAFSFEQDFLEPNITKLSPGCFKAEDYFIDIGIPEDYQRAQTELAKYA